MLPVVVHQLGKQRFAYSGLSNNQCMQSSWRIKNRSLSLLHLVTHAILEPDQGVKRVDLFAWTQNLIEALNLNLLLFKLSLENVLDGFLVQKLDGSSLNFDNLVCPQQLIQLFAHIIS
ncbi:hypothetical protein D3C75_814570 [compost metagenome]